MRSYSTAMMLAWCLSAHLAAAAPGFALTRQVPSQYPTIQSAIDSAVNGDVVLVAPGVYAENPILSGKTITIASYFRTTGNRDYIAQTVIDGGGGARVLRVGASTAIPAIEGLTLRNADDGVHANGKFQLLDSRVTGTGDGIDYETGSGGLVRGCVFEDNADDGIDLDHAVTTIIENNTIRNNGDDGIEMRFQPYSGPLLTVVIRDNVITGNDEDGIQLISYEVTTPRTVHIEGNLIANNAMAGIGIMCCENSVEDYQGASLKERVGVYNNTFAGNDHGITGGDSLIAVNNIFVTTTNTALKRADAGSIAAFNLFFGNGTDFSQSNVDAPTTLREDPLLSADHRLTRGSPAIDTGTASFEYHGRIVWTRDAAEYEGEAPDLGAFESTDAVDVIDDPDARGVQLLAPVPNPSGEVTMLSVVLLAPEHVRLEIVDVTGRQVRLITEGARAAGRHDLSWDGRNESGESVSAGVFFARLTTATRAESRRFVKL